MSEALTPVRNPIDIPTHTHHVADATNSLPPYDSHGRSPIQGPRSVLSYPQLPVPHTHFR